MPSNDYMSFPSIGNKEFTDLSVKASNADEKTKELPTRVTKIEDGLSQVNSRLAVIENELKNLKDTIDSLRKNVDNLVNKSSEQTGFWEGVKTSSKVMGWGVALIFSGVGALLMFLINQLFGK